MSTVNGVNTAYSAANSDSTKLSGDFDQFLRLLTTQLKNQDPLSPMDSTEFTNQLVSFSGVEQQIKMNKNLENLIAYSANSQTTLGLSYIGLQVEREGSKFNLYPDTSVSMTYELETDASQLKISVLDANGDVVYSRDGVEGEFNKGKHGFIWDGKDNNGDPATPGLYQIRVGAADQAGKTIKTTTVVPGVVMGMQTEDDGSVSLILNGEAVPMTDIRRATL